MSIRDELREQIKQALKAGQRDRLRALRLLKAELEVAETSGEEFDEVSVVKSFAKSLRRSAEEYEELERADRARELWDELEVVEQFLPPQMDEQELEQLIGAMVAQNDYGPRDIGKVMKAVMSEHGDTVDGRLAQQIARRKLEENA
ncbi:MAG: GatB/YqeY domain-containing protein [Candidatus Brocadiia bacterium]